VSSSLAGPLRLVSIVICLIVLASFALFAVNQTSSASTHQQEKVNSAASGSTVTPAGAASPHAKHSQEGAPRKAIDDVAEALTSPFSGVTAGSSSEWVTRGVSLLLALIVYGFGLGFLARVLRVRL
jgi:hypothetical protein